MLQVQHDRTQEFYDYWLSLDREGHVPHRSLFLPEEIPTLLSHMMMYEFVERGYIKFRLMGTSLTAGFGRDLEGGNYLDLVEGNRREVASEVLWRAVEHPCGMMTVSEQILTSGLTIRSEAIGLPLLNNPGGNPLLIIQKNPLYEERQLPGERIGEGPDPLRHNKILERSYIDIGAGIPEFPAE